MSALIALAGCPNTGKTSLFNALSGRQARVGNYPGITVERASAPAQLKDRTVQLVDVPGTYSLLGHSAEEQVAIDALLGLHGNPAPALTVVVIDGTQLERNLYFAMQIIELGRPVIVALNMMDATERAGITINTAKLSADMGVPVVGVSAATGAGLDALRSQIAQTIDTPTTPPPWRWTPDSALNADLVDLLPYVQELVPGESEQTQRALALWALHSVGTSDELTDIPADLRLKVLARQRDADPEQCSQVIAARYTWIDTHLSDWLTREPVKQTRTERVDRVLLHPIWGFGIFIGVMLLMFQTLFAWADPLIGLVEGTIGIMADAARSVLPEGMLADFIAEAIIGGVGNVVVFVPQIALLFLFLALMEASGYMSRVAFLMDRIMNRIGLHGRAFIPMLSAYACAIPSVLATRTMERKRDRYLTMMVLPLTTCSARLPVYTLMIAALVPSTIYLGFSAQSLVMVGLYLFGTMTALVAAAVIGRTVLKGERAPLLMEMPAYRRPKARDVLRRVWGRSWVFIRDAGAFIFVCTAILWVLLYFPRTNPDVEALQASAGSAEVSAHMIAGAQKRGSYAGQIGHAMEPILKPFGQDWQIGVGLLGAFAAREVFVSTMGLVFGMGGDVDEESPSLRERLRSERKPNGEALYTPLSALALLIFFALACQCMSTLAVVKRETGGYRWPLFMFTYMTVLAWVAAVVVYQGGRLLGFT